MKFNGTQYYYQGYSSHQTGLPYESSPHPIGSPARLEWCRGWRDAENDSRKRLTSTETDNANQQFESLAPKPDEVWNGEGLPPVGCICEGNFPRFGSLVWKWQDCLVLWRFENECAVRCIHTGTLHYCDDFRPTLTDEERKREEAVSALKELKPQLVGQLAGILYDQIAAGKIPHITLK